MTIPCFAALEARDVLHLHQYPPKKLGPQEVQIKVTHCGICRSDVHLIDDDFGISVYPLVPGHEIVGHVIQAGKNVTVFQEGERVGVGWQRSSCGECEWCRKGSENLCPRSEPVCVGQCGGFSEEVQVDARFAIPLPDVLDSEKAAPLFCAGVTVFAPMEELRPGMKVGVIGIGGLGHLAIQFARALGCRVTAFSMTPEKEKEARNLGADDFLINTDADEMVRLQSSLDFIVSTVPANIDWISYLHILRPNGKLCIVGVVPQDLVIPPFPLIIGQKSVCGSVIGSPATIRKMLQLAAEHKIQARTELMAMKDVNQAIEKLRANDVRYRMVLATG